MWSPWALSCHYLTNPFVKLRLIANSHEDSFGVIHWPCTIEIAWVVLRRPYPGSYRQEILANHAQKVRLQSTQALQSCKAIGVIYGPIGTKLGRQVGFGPT